MAKSLRAIAMDREEAALTASLGYLPRSTRLPIGRPATSEAAAASTSSKRYLYGINTNEARAICKQSWADVASCPCPTFRRAANGSRTCTANHATLQTVGSVPSSNSS